MQRGEEREKEMGRCREKKKKERGDGGVEGWIEREIAIEEEKR